MLPGPQHPDQKYRHQRGRQHIGSDHRKADRQRQRYEKIVRGALHEERGDKHRQDAQHRHEMRDRRLRGSLERGLPQRRASRQVRMDVLDGDGRLVDKDSDRQRQPAEGHQIDGLPRRPQGDRGGQDRQWNIHHDNHGASPIAKKQQHHQTRENRAESTFLGEAPNGARDVRGLVELIADLHARRQHGLEFGQALLDQAHDAERGSVGAFGDRYINGATAVHERIAGFDVRGIFGNADIRMKIVRVPWERIGTSPRRWTLVTTELTGTIGIMSPNRTFPEGLMVLPLMSACTTSSGLML